jgi:hypothetical protein
MLALLADTVLVPAIPAGLIALLIPRASGGSVRRTSLPFAIAIAAGILTSYQRVYGWPVMPPVSAAEWMPSVIAGAVVVLGLFEIPVRRSVGTEATANPFVTGVCLLVAASGNSLVAMFGYSASLSQASAGLAAAIGACLAVHLLRRNFRIGLASAGIPLVTLGLLIHIEHRYTDAPTSSVLLVLAGLVAGFLPLPRLFASSSPLPRAAVRIAATALPVAIGVAIAYAGYEPPPY